MFKQRLSELPVEAFRILSDHFLPGRGGSRPFSLRDKRGTQDDPLEKYILDVLKQGLGPSVTVEESTGPLVSPDMVAYRPATCAGGSRAEFATSERSIIGIEVKKLRRTSSGSIARASGIDYNTTPPSGFLQVYDADFSAIKIKGYYLFVCQEPATERQGLHCLSALAFCDGNILNEDFQFYLEITGQRTKEIGLGSYKDGANRMRPMLVFPNPLSTEALDHQSTLLHARDDLEEEHDELIKVGVIERSIPSQGGDSRKRYYCYRRCESGEEKSEMFSLINPFKTPKSSPRTTRRGRFIVPIKTVA